jgi:hypothetical protein
MPSPSCRTTWRWRAFGERPGRYSDGGIQLTHGARFFHNGYTLIALPEVAELIAASQLETLADFFAKGQAPLRREVFRTFRLEPPIKQPPLEWRRQFASARLKILEIS